MYCSPEDSKRINDTHDLLRQSPPHDVAGKHFLVSLKAAARAKRVGGPHIDAGIPVFA